MHSDRKSKNNDSAMIIQVRLLHFASKKFTYRVPKSLDQSVAVGTLVQVPLMHKVIPALVEEIDATEKFYGFAIKDIDSVCPFPQDSRYQSFTLQVAKYYQIDPLVLFRRVQLFLAEQEESVIILPQSEHKQDEVVFTQQQQDAFDAIVPAVIDQRHDVFVLHGVTGSGKTEVYKKLVAQALAQNKAVILLFPEVTLCLRFEKIFAQTFETVPIIGFHSATSASKKRQLWQLLLEQKPVIIVGVHLPILLPIAHLGLIIVDEEHDHGYQEKKHPKIHSRDMAILRGFAYQVPVVLGSATPSMQSLWNVQQRGWKLLSMTQRYAGKFPKIQFVSLKDKALRKHMWIHSQLFYAIQDRLQRSEQTIIFLNRRGYSFFVQCPCSFVFECHQCSVSLTLHHDNVLMCHYCGHQETVAAHCFACKGSSDQFLKKGIGTQQLVAILQKLFPSARIARADLDTTSKKRTWNQTVEDMYAGNIDILVGTQSITKGYHFPKVTLVGVLWADLNLHFPMYNAAEVTLQQLIQVAGRAGRQSDDSLVIVQAFDEHDIFKFIDETKYQQYFEYEIQHRLQAMYPPCGHIAEIELKSEDQEMVAADGQTIAQQLRSLAAKTNIHLDVFGPVPSLIYKVKQTYCQKLLLKSASRIDLINLFAQVNKSTVTSHVYFTVDPVA